MALPADMVSSRLSVAPMMEWTDRHYRFLVRMMTARTKLYTEMVVAGDLAKKDPIGVGLLLDCSPEEQPVALQLGGNDPEQLRIATDTAFTHNNSVWDEINLNCGCPSERVTSCVFGAALMHDAEVVRQCVSQMARASRGVPVTVKCRYVLRAARRGRPGRLKCVAARILGAAARDLTSMRCSAAAPFRRILGAAAHALTCVLYLHADLARTNCTGTIILANLSQRSRPAGQ